MEVFLFSFSLLDSVMDGKRSSAREEKRFSVDLLPPTYMHPIFLVSMFSFYRRVRGMIHLVTSLYPNMRHDTCLILRTSNSVYIYIVRCILMHAILLVSNFPSMASPSILSVTGRCNATKHHIRDCC